MKAQHWSIRRRMLAIALSVVLLAWLAGSVASLAGVQQTSERMRDARLVQLAQTIAAFTEHELAEIALNHSLDPFPLPDAPVHVEATTALAGRYHFQIWSRHGELLMRTEGAPDASRLAAARQAGFSDAMLSGHSARVYALLMAANGLEVQVADTKTDDDALALMFTPAYFATMALSVAAMLIFAGWLIVRTLRPVADAERALRQRDALELAPLNLHDVPQEMQPMLAALNRLLQDGAQRLSRERGFTALAAHELRTPLAALRLQAQVAQRESDPAQRHERLSTLIVSVDRCTHLLEQLLTLARVEQPDASDPPRDVPLDELIDEVLDELGAEIDARGLQVQQALQVRQLQAHRFGLQTLLRNLLCNAIAHSPEGGSIRIASAEENHHLVLTLDDAGPGISEPDRARVFGRFVRLGGTAAGRGSGLGMSIVQAVVQDHHARIELLDSALGGLRVRITFPPAAGPGDSPARALSR